MIELPTDLPADLAPLSWLIGEWEGTGVIDYHAGGTHYEGEFTHRVSFRHESGPSLTYTATARLLEGEGGRPLNSESGFWRLARPATESEPGPGLLPPVAPSGGERTAEDVEALRASEGGFPLEVSLVHSDGVSELYLGQVNGPRVDLATDAVVRGADTRHYAAATRMYGLVDGHLLWAWDIAAMGGELASHASARLARVS